MPIPIWNILRAAGTGLLPRAETFVREMLSLQLFHLTLQGPDLIAVIIYYLRYLIDRFHEMLDTFRVIGGVILRIVYRALCA
jgi:hypothetical protein